MAEMYTGEVRDGVVVFDEGTPPLPEGMKVQVEPVDMEAAVADLSRRLLSIAGIAKGLPSDFADQDDHDDSTPTLAERLRPIIGAGKGLPSDMAEQHDHYIHGTPKR